MGWGWDGGGDDSGESNKHDRNKLPLCLNLRVVDYYIIQNYTKYK